MNILLMKSKLRILGVIALAAVLVTAVAAAGCVGSDPIVGKWGANLSGGEYYEFNGDGTGACSFEIIPGAPVSFPFTWEKVSDGTYKVSASLEQYGLPLSGDTEVHLSADGKTLTLGKYQKLTKF